MSLCVNEWTLPEVIILTGFGIWGNLGAAALSIQQGKLKVKVESAKPQIKIQNYGQNVVKKVEKRSKKRERFKNYKELTVIID